MTFEQFYKILIKRWSIVVLCFLLAGAGAYFGSSKLIMKPIYQSTALIEVAIRANNSPLLQDNILASEQLAQTEANLAATSQILGEVASRYPGLTADTLAKNVTATVRSNTQLFDITVQDPSPTQAANIANDIAATLIKQQLQLAQQPATQSFLVVAQSAQPAALPVRPNKTLNTGAGLLIGLLLGILLAVLLDVFDTRIRTKEELMQVLNWPILGTIWRVDNESAFNLNNHNSNTDAYTTLRANIGFATLNKPLHTLVVTSATPNDGKSIIAANLAASMAKAGKNTLLIEANLHHPTQYEPFGIPDHARGFSNALVAFKPNTPGEPSLIPYIQTTAIPNLRVMPSGPLPPNPPELLDSKAMQRFLSVLSHSETEIVIFDAPSLLGLPDAMILASKGDGTLVVVDITRARKKDLQQVKDSLEQAGAQITGCVVNKQRPSHKNTPYKNARASYNEATESDYRNGKKDSSKEDINRPINVSSVETLTAIPAFSPTPRPTADLEPAPSGTLRGVSSSTPRPAPTATFEPVPSSTPRMVTSPTPRPASAIPPRQVSSSASWQETPSQPGLEGQNDAGKQSSNTTSIVTPSEKIAGDKSRDKEFKLTQANQKKDR